MRFWKVVLPVGEMKLRTGEKRLEAGRPREQLQWYCINEVRNGYDLTPVTEEIPWRAENRLRNTYKCQKSNGLWELLAGGNGD